MGGEHGIIQLFVRGREFSCGRPGGPGACYVGDVSTIGAACVYEDEVLGGDERVVHDVVDRVGVLPCGNDGDVGACVAAVEAEAVFEGVCERALGCPALAHGGCEGSAGHAAYVAEEGDLGGGFDGSEIVEEGL